MRQIGQGLATQYAESGDAEQKLHEEMRLRWLRVCPDDPNREYRVERDLTGYVSNRPSRRSPTRRATSKSIRLFEAAERYYQKDVDPVQWFAETNQLRTWNRIAREIAPDRHFRTSANYLYFDGHVQSIPASTIEQWADADFNFGLPNQGEYAP